MIEINFDDVFKINHRVMRLNRTHPEVRRDIKWLIFFFIVHGLFTILFCIVLYNIIYHDLSNNDFNKICQDGIFTIVYVVTTYHYIIMVWKQDSINYAIRAMKEDYESMKSATKEDQEVTLKYALKSKWISRQWMNLAYLGFGMFPLKNAILYFNNYIHGVFKLVPVYDLVYPRVIEEKKDVFIVYLMQYAYILYYAMYSAGMYASFVPLGPVFMLHACGRIELLIKRMEKLVEDKNLDEIMKELKSIIIELQRTYELVYHIKEIVRIAYELTLKGSTIILPITIYEFIHSFHQGEISIEFIVFIIGGAMISISPCYYSELLMGKGDEFRDAVFSCGWEHVYDQRVRSSIVLILQRALRPTAIHTMFRTVCLDALTDLSQQSYAIFNLMNAMWD